MGFSLMDGLFFHLVRAYLQFTMQVYGTYQETTSKRGQWGEGQLWERREKKAIERKIKRKEKREEKGKGSKKREEALSESISKNCC